MLLLRAVLAEKTRSVGRCLTLQPESSKPSWDYWCLRCQGFWPLPPLSPSFLSLPPSHQTPSFVVQYLGKDTASFCICKLFTNYMHRHMGSNHILHRPERGSGEDCGFLSLGGWASHQAWTYLQCFQPYNIQAQVILYFPCSWRRERPYRKLGNQTHSFAKKTLKKQKTKEKLSLSILFLSVFLYFQISLHESKKFSHQPLISFLL